MEISIVPNFIPPKPTLSMPEDPFDLDLDISTIGSYEGVSRPWNTKNNTCPQTCHCESEFGTCTCR